jgi:Uri superfamily endonuclease
LRKVASHQTSCGLQYTFWISSGDTKAEARVEYALNEAQSNNFKHWHIDSLIPFLFLRSCFADDDDEY